MDPAPPAPATADPAPPREAGRHPLPRLRRPLPPGRLPPAVRRDRGRARGHGPDGGRSRDDQRHGPWSRSGNAADPRRPLYYLEDDARAYWYSATDPLVARAVESLPAEQRHRFHPFITGFNGTDLGAVDHVVRMLECTRTSGRASARSWGATTTSLPSPTVRPPGPTTPALNPIYELAADRDLPVSVHQNVGSVWLREPVYLHECGETPSSDIPGLVSSGATRASGRRIVIPDLTVHLARMLLTYPNLWIDVSWNVLREQPRPGGCPGARMGGAREPVSRPVHDRFRQGGQVRQPRGRDPQVLRLPGCPRARDGHQGRPGELSSPSSRPASRNR